jgi:cytochrome c
MIRPSGLALSLLLIGGFTGTTMTQAASVPAGVHPNWTKIDLRPAGFQPQVSGMAFQSDGKLLIAHWNSSRALASRVGDTQPRTYQGRIYLLSGVTGAAPAVTMDTVATGLEDVMGMTLVNDTIYVSGGNAILRLVRPGGLTGPVTRRDTIFFLPGTPVNGDSLKPARGSQEYLYGLLHRGGKFYAAASALDPSGSGTAQVNPYRGTLLEVTPGDGVANKRGSFRILATGLRAPSGISFGPDSTICASDNQGEWLPASKLNCLKEGRFYGARKSGGANDYYAPWDALTETPPTAWVIQTDIGNSPTQPVFAAAHTPYAGQMLMGDVRWGTGINRYFVERNGQGELQAAIFVFTGGLEAGVFRMLWGPDSMLYVGMIGGRDDNDGYPLNLATRVDYGLQKLRYTGGDTAFEMRAIRSRPEGFEIEFTRPVDSTVARAAQSYTVQSYHMTPGSGYGSGSKQGTATLTPSSIQLSPDRRKVYLALSGLVPTTGNQMRVVYFRLNGFKSAAGASPWSAEAWYTLNALGTGTPFDLPVALRAPLSENAAALGEVRWIVRQGNLHVRIPATGKVAVRLRGVSGALLAELRPSGTGEAVLPLGAVPARFAILEVTGEGIRFRRLIELR